jgi:hypothetical protein
MALIPPERGKAYAVSEVINPSSQTFVSGPNRRGLDKFECEGTRFGSAANTLKKKHDETLESNFSICYNTNVLFA